MQLKETREALNKFAKYVIQQARTNLTKEKKNVTKELYNSLEYMPFIKGDKIGVKFYMEDYGVFQDRGVKGTKSNYIENKKSPFSYKKTEGNKGMPPPKAFADFIKKKGIKGRDKKSGRFITTKSLQFLIARSIFQKGIKASMFFTKPFERAFKYLPPELHESFVTDIENAI